MLSARKQAKSNEPFHLVVALALDRIAPYGFHMSMKSIADATPA
jgi:hypothetical protein